MKKASFVAVFVACVVSTVLLLIGLRPADSAATFDRTFALTYQIRLLAIPPQAQELRVWVPLAGSNEHQKIRRRVIQAPGPYQVTRDPDYKNDILYLDFHHPMPSALHLSVEYDAFVRGKQFQLAQVHSKIPAPDKSLEPFLKSNPLMVVDDTVRQLGHSVTSGAKTPLEEAQAIYRYVIERMSYDKKTPGWGKGDTLRACAVGTGNCTDFHSLFISLARSRGIPARFTIGLPVPEKPQGEIPGYHCWAEFYLDGVGWVPVDASEAWKDRKRQDYFFGSYDPNRLAVSMGRDIHLVPPPAGGPVNIFFRPVVEVDGKPFDGVEMKFHFRDLARKGE